MIMIPTICDDNKRKDLLGHNWLSNDDNIFKALVFAFFLSSFVKSD